MKLMSCNILIVGSGLTGLVAAYSLSLLGFKIILTEQKKILNNKNIITHDTRTTAIAEGSKVFLDHIGLWKKLSLFAEPIKNINVIDRSIKNKIEFFNSFRDHNLGYIVKNSKCVITDSGGITEETTVMGIPCITLRDNTERPETVTEGTNELIGTNPKKLVSALKKLFAGNWKKGSIPNLWDGQAADRIIKHLVSLN